MENVRFSEPQNHYFRLFRQNICTLSDNNSNNIASALVNCFCQWALLLVGGELQ